ncbi:MAG: sulfite exporter TauE/SafE family protein [Gemmatimonadales bacterium]
MSFYVLIFGAGFFAGIINVMAGGGSLLTLPILMFLGLPAPLANGTNRVALVMQNIAAVEGFRRNEIWDPKSGISLALAMIPGAVAGALVAIRVPEDVFRTILAAVLIVAVITMLRPQPQRTESITPSKFRRRWAYLALVGVGFYGGFIQAGVGLLLIAVLYQLLGFTLVWVNMYKVLIVGVYLVPTLVIFHFSSNVDWATGFILGLGNAGGALVSTHISVKGGERVIRYFISAALILMALRLLAVV